MGRPSGLWRADWITVVRWRAWYGHGLGERTSGSRAAECASRRSGRSDAGRDNRRTGVWPCYGLDREAAQTAWTARCRPRCDVRTSSSVPDPKIADAGLIESLLSTVFVLALAVLMGEKLNEYAREAGFLLPGFLSAMIAGVIITNLADIFKHPLEFGLSKRVVPSHFSSSSQWLSCRHP